MKWLHKKGKCLVKNTDITHDNFEILEVKAVRLQGNRFAKQIRALDFKAKDNSIVAGFSNYNDMYTDDGRENDTK